jgi:hypothetical protein
MRLLPLLALVACTPVGFTPPLDGDRPAAPSSPVATSTEPDAGTLPPVPPPSPPRKVWKDSTGAIVAWDDLTWFDGNGNVWTISPATANVLEVPDAGRVCLLFLTTDCTGPTYTLASVPARQAFQLRSESTWRVRPDTLQAQALTVQSAKVTGSTSCADRAPFTCGEFVGEQSADPFLRSASPPRARVKAFSEFLRR